MFDKKNKVAKLLTWGAAEGKQASNEVVRSIVRSYPRIAGWDLEEYDYGEAWGSMKNPFMESLVGGMGTGAGMAVAAGRVYLATQDGVVCLEGKNLTGVTHR